MGRNSSSTKAIAGVLSVMRNISVPFGAPNAQHPEVNPTLWRTVADLTNGVYFFESTTSPNIIWVEAGRRLNWNAVRVYSMLRGEELDKFSGCLPEETTHAPVPRALRALHVGHRWHTSDEAGRPCAPPSRRDRKVLSNNRTRPWRTQRAWLQPPKWRK